MSGLPWVRFDTDFPDNPKVLQLLSRRGGAGTAFVYCCSLAYSGRHGTDGFIPSAALGRIHGKKADAATLVEIGMWDEAGEGWVIRNWDEYQQASETTESVLAAKRAGSAKGNCRRWHGPDCRCYEQKLRAVR